MNDSPDNPKRTYRSTRITGVTRGDGSQCSDGTGGSPVFIKFSPESLQPMPETPLIVGDFRSGWSGFVV